MLFTRESVVFFHAPGSIILCVCRKCDELEAKLAQLGEAARQNAGEDNLKAELVTALSSGSITQENKPDAAVSAHDVLCWAEDVK